MPTPKETINQLKNIINEHNIYYYVKDNPIISDSEYDELMHWVGGEYPPVVTPSQLVTLAAHLYAAEAYFKKYGVAEKPTNEKVTFEHANGDVFCTLTLGGEIVLWK